MGLLLSEIMATRSSYLGHTLGNELIKANLIERMLCWNIYFQKMQLAWILLGYFMYKILLTKRRGRSKILST